MYEPVSSRTFQEEKNLEWEITSAIAILDLAGVGRIWTFHVPNTVDKPESPSVCPYLTYLLAVHPSRRWEEIQRFSLTKPECGRALLSNC